MRGARARGSGNRRRDAFEQYLANEDEYDFIHQAKRQKAMVGYASAIANIAASITAFAGKKFSNHQGRAPGAKTVKRKRLDVEEMCHNMSDKHFRRRYRMDKDSFWRLLHIIEDHLPSTGENRSRRRGAVPNGPISHAARLSMALRIAAGGDPLDIASNHGVHDGEPMTSFWNVVDAIHQSSQLDIKFPSSHDEQELLAEEFKSKSDIGISHCVGAIDGILMWIHMPTTSDCEELGIGPSKFYCGRKKKYGLNMQAVCDARRRFLWVELKYPGSTSDFFAFDQSSFKSQLEQEGFLRRGLCLFGDAAYANSPYMVTPFRTATGTKDDFNFFQSQLRINIECAFGMLVHRFGMLRKAFPMGVSVSNTNRAIMALCKLHNFCIDANSGDDIGVVELRDAANIIVEGGMSLPRIDVHSDDAAAGNGWSYEDADDRLDDLLDGGDHMDDHTYDDRRRYRNLFSPRHMIFQHVVSNGFRRPPRRG